MNWLDTETKAILHKEPDEKLAPPKAGEFALVVLEWGKDLRRNIRAVCRINGCTELEAMELAQRTPPFAINIGLTEAEALKGQFELICCDSISVFLRSDVWSQSDAEYLQSILHKVRNSPEFRPTPVLVYEIPDTDSGTSFVDQFIGEIQDTADDTEPVSFFASHKKARIMTHWAKWAGVVMDGAGV
ncbi:MAG TPA: hypothetical protein VK968_13160 [Roseimicrobium sp.]|nr:hypothetical protein [Roseimicrobium sp.]